MSKQDTHEITKQVEFMLSQNLNNSQAYQVASMTYFYFLDDQNVELSKKLLDIIERKGNEDEVAYDRMLYRILIEKKSEDVFIWICACSVRDMKNSTGKHRKNTTSNLYGDVCRKLLKTEKNNCLLKSKIHWWVNL